MPFTFKKLSIPGLILVIPKLFRDERGFFMETYQHDAFADGGITEMFVQDNSSRSVKNTIRALHFQTEPFAQGKLVRVTRGQIFDVAVDIRRGSPFFGQWLGVTLSDENREMLYLPPGFAHGFCVLSEIVDVSYKCTRPYSPGHERGIIWNDPDIAVEWRVREPILSEQDKRWPELKAAEIDHTY